jgi:hypothetical protein
MIPTALFGLALWGAYLLVGAGALFLLAMLVKEWRKNELW